MPTAIVLDKKRIFVATVDPVADAEIDEALAAVGDLVYVPDQIIIPNTVTATPTITEVQITDASDVVQFSGTVATANGTGLTNIILQKGITEFYTDAAGNEVIPMPDGLIIKGGWKIKTSTTTLTDADYGLFTVYGHMAKLL